MPRNRLPRVLKHYSPTGRRNHGRPLKTLDTWDRNGSTSGPIPWQIDDDDDCPGVYTMFKNTKKLGIVRKLYDIIRFNLRWRSRRIHVATSERPAGLMSRAMVMRSIVGIDHRLVSECEFVATRLLVLPSIISSWDMGKQRLYWHFQVLCVLNSITQSITITILPQKKKSFQLLTKLQFLVHCIL